jgi:hypothetical protein
MLVYFFFLIIGLILIVGLVSNYNARHFGQGVAERLKTMENLYESFLKRKLESENFDPKDLRYAPEVLAKEAMQMLSPTLDGLLNYINEAYLPKVRIKYQSKYFPNLIAHCEDGFESSKKNSEKRLTLVEIERFRMALYDALWADLNHRIIKIEDENSTVSM